MQATAPEIVETSALYSPTSGFNKSAIMSRALAGARESRAWQIKFAASPNGIREGSKPQSWRFLIAFELRSSWTFARAERAQHEFKPTSAAHA